MCLFKTLHFKFIPKPKNLNSYFLAVKSCTLPAENRWKIVGHQDL